MNKDKILQDIMALADFEDKSEEEMLEECVYIPLQKNEPAKVIKKLDSFFTGKERDSEVFKKIVLYHLSQEERKEVLYQLI